MFFDSTKKLIQVLRGPLTGLLPVNDDVKHIQDFGDVQLVVIYKISVFFFNFGFLDFGLDKTIFLFNAKRYYTNHLPTRCPSTKT